MTRQPSPAALAAAVEAVAGAHPEAAPELVPIAAALRSVAAEGVGAWGGHAPAPFWEAPDGLRLAGVELVRSGRALRVRFAAGAEYLVPVSALRLRHRVEAVAIDDLAHGFALSLRGGERADVASDWVLATFEPAYRHATPAAPPRGVGARIRAIRLGRGLTARDVADAAGMARSNYSRLESGRHEPEVKTLLRVAAALRVPLAVLLGAPADGLGAQ